MSRSIGEPFPDDTTDRAIGPPDIVNAQRDPIVMPEIELGEVTVKVLLAHVLIDPINPAFQDREEILGGIGRCVSPHVLFLSVIDGAVTGEPLADTMPDEPASFEIDAQSPTELVRAEPLLRGAHQVHSLQPNVHWDVALLEDGPDLDSERLTAGVALVDAYASALASQSAALPDHAAMGTDAAIWPNQRFDIGVSGGLIPEARLIEDGSWHGSISLSENI
jgi:hypothetical protein